MKDDLDRTRRLQRAHLAVLRFGPVVTAELSRWWTNKVAPEPGWSVVRDWLKRSTDPHASLGLDDIPALLGHITRLLDLWDEDPTGTAYYPYKAAELIELHLQEVTGDHTDESPVHLDEWISRFADHVNWQLKESGIRVDPQQYFTALEESLQEKEQRLDGADETAFRLAKEAAAEAGERYVGFLRSALAGSD